MNESLDKFAIGTVFHMKAHYLCLRLQNTQILNEIMDLHSKVDASTALLYR